MAEPTSREINQPYQPPQPPPGYPPPYPQQFGHPPRPPQPKANWKVIGIVIAAAIVVSIIGLVSALRDSARARDAVSNLDATVTSCDLSAGVGTVEFTVRNSGTENVRSVAVEIEYQDSSGARIDTDTAYVRDVGPGETVRAQEVTSLDVPVTSGRCGIAIRG